MQNAVHTPNPYVKMFTPKVLAGGALGGDGFMSIPEWDSNQCKEALKRSLNHSSTHDESPSRTDTKDAFLDPRLPRLRNCGQSQSAVKSPRHWHSVIAK